MSRIYFHVRDGEAFELRGSERAYSGLMVDGLALGVAQGLGIIGAFGWGERVVKGWKNLPVGREMSALRSLASDESLVSVAPSRTETAWVVNLNTALIAGNDAYRVMTRLHAQCEIHCFVRDANRAWLGLLISAGVQRGVLREPWQPLAQWLVEGRGDVVCSYSVCDRFPYWEREDDTRSREERWDAQFPALDPTLELTPENWEPYRFADGDSWFSVAKFADSLPKESR